MEPHDHLTDEQLARYLEGSLAGEERNRAEGHMASCPRCLDTVAVSRKVLGPRRTLRAHRWAAAAAAVAALALGALVWTAVDTEPRLGLDELVRDLRVDSGGPWGETLAAWRDLASVSPASLDLDEFRVLERTMSRRDYIPDGLSPAAQEFVRRSIRRTILRTPRTPQVTEPRADLLRELESVKGMSSRGELHPWALQRFIELCEGDLAARPPFQAELKRMGLSRAQFLDRLKSRLP
jgi:hypothetical protein